MAPSAQAKWLQAESAHFKVYTEGSEASAREYATMLEDFDALLRRMHGNPADEAPPRKLDVYLLASTSQVKRILGVDGFSGFYWASPTDIFAMAVRDEDDRDQTLGDDTVLHEYVHHFMMQYHEAPYPAWLIEGYAEYYSTADLAPKRITIGSVSEGSAYLLRNPGWLPMEDVLGKTVSQLKESDYGAFYAQAWFLTHYVLADNGRRAKLNVYLREWRKDGDSVKAWKTAFGEDPAELTRSLRAYQKRPLMGRVVTRDQQAPAAITVTTLSAGADEVLLEIQRIKYGVPAAQREELLRRVRAIHARMPADRYVRIALARAETRWGDRPAGEAILEAMVRDDPRDAEALILLAESQIAAGRADAALRGEKNASASRHLGAAMKIAPDDYRIYSLYGQTRMGLRGEPSENTLNVLIRAVQLAPQVRGSRLNAASALIAVKADQEARDMLEPLLNDPHSSTVTKQARALLARLEGREPDVGTEAAGDDDDEE